MHTERSHLTAWKDDFDGNPLSTQLAKHLSFKQNILQGEFQPLLISIFAHFTCQELAWGTACCIRYTVCLSYTTKWIITFDSHGMDLLHINAWNHTVLSHSQMKIKFRTVTVFQNASWPCSATGRITIIQTFPSLYQHYSIRQLLGQLIRADLWTVVSTPSCGCLPVAPPSDQ